MAHYSDTNSFWRTISKFIWGMYVRAFYFTFFLAFDILSDIFLAFKYLCSSVAYILTFCLALFLASILTFCFFFRTFYLAYVQKLYLAFFPAFFLACYLTFYLAFCLAFSLCSGRGMLLCILRTRVSGPGVLHLIHGSRYGLGPLQPTVAKKVDRKIRKRKKEKYKERWRSEWEWVGVSKSEKHLC